MFIMGKVIVVYSQRTWGAYYLEEVRQRLIAQFGEEKVYTAGLQVYTGIDFKHQENAEKALRDGLRASSKRRGWQGPVDLAIFLEESPTFFTEISSGLNSFQSAIMKSYVRISFSSRSSCIAISSFVRFTSICKALSLLFMVGSARSRTFNCLLSV